MKRKLRQKIPRYRSKKGMTLVEILAGVVIIVIVFGATLSAMTNGFAVTLYNASTNKYAVEGESVNEIILQAIAKQEFSDGSSAKIKLEADDNPIDQAAKAVVSDITYVKFENFEDSDAENKYTVDFSAKNAVIGTSVKGKKSASYTVDGMIIITSVTTSNGRVRNTSFVAYSDQDGK